MNMRYTPLSPPHAARHMGMSHMVASGHYLATQAAFSILEAGGNAIDAGVAGGLVLGVVQSEYAHLGGVAPIMLRWAETDEIVTISGLGWWPKAASARYFRENHGGRIPTGNKRAVVPGAPDAFLTALDNYGTLSFGDVASAAVAFAENGFPISTLMAEVMADRSVDFLNWPENKRVFMPDGTVPPPGSVMRLTDLAGSMRYMADEERAASRKGREAGIQAARDAFYKGDIAAAIDRFHRENDGWLRLEDLAGFRVGLEAPVRARYRDVDVYTCGPWCQGPVLGEALGILDVGLMSEVRHNAPDYLHHLIEALKLSFSDRDAYYIDPRFGKVPVDRLVSEDYGAIRRQLIDPQKAWSSMPPAGLPDEVGRDAPPAAREWVEPDLDTTYICVVDGEGNAFSCTPSDGCLSGPMVPGTGISPSARGGQSWTDESHPACLAPGKRPRLTPSPALARRAGDWQMPFGTPGNDVQPQAMLQSFLNIVEFGMPLGEAIMQPRFATYSFPATSDPHRYYPGKVSLESRIAPETIEALSALGHQTAMWPDWEWRAGSVCAILANERTGIMEGSADWRRPGSVIGR